MMMIGPAERLGRSILKLKAIESADTRNTDDIETPSFELSWTTAPNQGIF